MPSPGALPGANCSFAAPWRRGTIAAPPSRCDDEGVAYDEELAARIRHLLTGAVDFTEKKMFGGLAFLVGGNMAVSASGQGGLMLRANPTASDELCSHPGVERAVMRGRAMDGWLRVSDDVTRDDDGLARWVRVGVGYAASLPPK